MRYFNGCSFEAAFWLEAGIADSKVKKTRRSAIPDRIRTRPIRNSPIVSGRFERDVRIMFTP